MYYLPNPGYVPKKASSCLETYIKSRYSDIKTRLKQVPYYNMRHNIAIKNILNNLTNDHSIIITNADKNLGIVVMNRYDYEIEVLNI